MLNDYEKDCFLVLDEMCITEGIVYDVGLKTFLGNVTLPDHEGIANYGIVFMLGGISSRRKQTITLLVILSMAIRLRQLLMRSF